MVFFCVQPVFAEILTIEMVLSEAQKNSFDIKIAQENVQASRAFIGEAQADYFPRLSVRFGNEYVHVFEEDGDIVSVGDAIIANNASGYKHSLIAGLSYNLFDFGVRQLTVQNAKRQEMIAGQLGRQSLWDVHKEILERYSSALKLQKQIRAMETIFKRQNAIFRLIRQLQQAGTVGREQVGTAALDLAETLRQRDDLKVRYQDALGSLSFYTQQTYLGEMIELGDLVQPDEVNPQINLDFFPEVLVYQQQIENKKAELSIVKRSMLPKLTLSGAYRMFGSDDDTFGDSFSSMSSRDASVTVYLEWPVFAGFESLAKKKRLQHELASLGYQKLKKKAELQQEFSSIVNNYETYTMVQENRQQQLVQIDREQSDAQRLSEQQITDQISFHNKMIQLIRQRLQVEIWQVDYATTALALDFMNKVVQ